MAWPERLLNLVRPGRLDREIARELAFHVEETAAALRAAGWSERDAAREARRRLGSQELHRERMRDANVIEWLESLLRDVRHALRSLRLTPVFSLAVVLSLALGTGANTAVFTLLNAVVLRSLPVSDAGELVLVGMGGDGKRPAEFTNPLWEAIRDRRESLGLRAAAAFGPGQFHVAAAGERQRVEGEYVSGDYFRLMGVGPHVGRVLTAADDVRGCAPVAVLGHGFWERAYGADRSVIGRTLVLEGVPFEIVGVVRRGFGGAVVGREVQVYAPLCAVEAAAGQAGVLDRRGVWWLVVMGRRDPSVALEQLNARLAAIAPAVYGEGGNRDEEEARPAIGELTAVAAPAGVSGLREQYGSVLLILMAGVALVLLIACANVANLLIARATAREREFQVRAAIGAGRSRLVRQLATESLLLAALGAALGLLVAQLGARALLSLQAEPIALDTAPDARVLAFTGAVAVATAFLFGLAPAWRAARANARGALHARGIAEGHGGFSLGKGLVAAQIALSVVLLSGAGLLVGSLRNLLTLDPGFTAERVLTVTVDAREANLAPDAARVAQQDLLRRLRALPGVRSASTAALLPVGRARWNGELKVDGFTPQGPRDGVVWFNEVSEDHFTTLDTRLLAGRDFAPSDAAGGARVAIVSAAVARKFFGGNAVGKQFRAEPAVVHPEPYTVVAVVEDAKYTSLREETSETVYLAASQAAPGPWPAFELRSEDPRSLAGAVRAAVLETHPALTVQLATLSEQLARSLQRERVLALLSAAFASVAFALAVLGLYGVVSYGVTRRRNEIGVRIALGAQPGRVLRTVLGDTGRVLAFGLGAGLVGTLATTRLVASFLFGLSPLEPAILAGATALLAVAALAAAAIPGWRATRTDPAMTLRQD